MNFTWLKGHGFNDRSGGANNIDMNSAEVRREAASRGITMAVDHDTMDYGYWKLSWVRLRKHGPVMRMVEAIEAALKAGNSVVLEGYSNGWNYILKALYLICDEYLVLAPGQHIYLIGVHPAGTTEPQIPPCVKAVMIYYSRSDWAVRWATWAAWLGIAPDWGRLGAVGYEGSDPRFKQRRLTDVAKGHGGAYQGATGPWLARKQVEWLAAEEGIK